MNKKVVQVAMTIDSVGKYFVLAVCSDGTLYQLEGLYEGKARWTPFPLPQEPKGETE